MPRTRIPPQTLEGWYVLHQLVRISWPGLRRCSAEERDRITAEMDDLLAEWGDLGDGGWSGSYRMIGGGVDAMLVHFRPTLDELARVERRLDGAELSDYLHVDYDYTSVVELGMYRLTAEVVEELRDEGVDPLSQEGRRRLEAAAEEERSKRYVQGRLQPRQPDDMPYVCFYPMDKRRSPGQNWYTLSLEQRNELMVEHGEIGRLYAGRISQIISGSIGFDDWEWGVTLFAGEPLDFKRLVSEMRFDEASALYAEFGPFYVGRRMESGGWTHLVEGA